jgi:hypothetical protein
MPVTMDRHIVVLCSPTGEIDWQTRVQGRHISMPFVLSYENTEIKLRRYRMSKQTCPT